MIIDGGEEDSRNVGLKECIRNNIVLINDMSYNFGQHTDKPHVPGFMGQSLGSTGKGKGEWVMISEDG